MNHAGTASGARTIVSVGASSPGPAGDVATDPTSSPRRRAHYGDDRQDGHGEERGVEVVKHPGGRDRITAIDRCDEGVQASTSSVRLS